MPVQEVEVKLRVSDLDALSHKLAVSGFKLLTSRTHEMNTLYDFPDGRLRSRGEVLRIRKYGEKWTLTHKSKGNSGKHKSRVETETQIEDGNALAHVFAALGLAPRSDMKSTVRNGVTGKATWCLMKPRSATSPSWKANRSGSTAPPPGWASRNQST